MSSDATNPLEGTSDAELVRVSTTRPLDAGMFAIEMMRRLKDVIVAQEKAATSLGGRIWWLNLWLLIFTIAIFALTGILVWKELVS